MGTLPELENRPGIRRVIPETKTNGSISHTPTGQQTIESHVVVPATIAFITGIIVTGLAAAVMVRWFQIDVFILMLTFCGVFLAVFFKRIGVGDRLLWLLEEFFDQDIDGDGAVGFAPRDIPVISRGKERFVNMPPTEAKLTRSQWAEVATAALNKRAKISRRALQKNSRLSQSEAALAAKILHEGKRAIDNELTGSGWDWLIVFLPGSTQCRLERPTDTHPPTPQNGNNPVYSGASTSQPTS